MENNTEHKLSKEYKNELQPIRSKKRNSVIEFLLLLNIIIEPIFLHEINLVSTENLNRLGIILNFMAGFMVAPDLIGIKSIRDIETNIEVALKNIKIPFYEILIETRIFYAVLAVCIISSYSSYTFFKFIILSNKVGTALIIYIGIVALIILSTIRFEKGTNLSINFIKAKYIEIKNHIFWILILAFIIPIFITISPIVIIILTIFSKILYFTIDILEGEERLKSIFIRWGIIFFIMGNLMQLWATFPKK